MVVDDVPQNVELLTNMLEAHGYRVFAFIKGELALNAAKKNPPDLFLLDVRMPGLDGYQVCEKLKADPELTKIPVVFLSALSDLDDKITAFHAGGVDYITKPFQFEEVLIRVRTHLKIKELQEKLELYNNNLQQLVAEQVKEISEAQMSIIFALAKLAEYRDADTGGHLERVQEFCRLLAEALQKDSPYKNQIDPKYVANIFLASPLHDIGKVAIPDRILLKPDKLNDEEFAVMKTHAIIGAEYLEEVLTKYPKNAFIKMGVEVARFSHERWDGKGYPLGLAGEAIPLSARIMALADVYDALRSKRCYKKPVDHKIAFQVIVDASGTQFDPVIVEAFVKLSDAFNNYYREASN